MFWFKLNLLRCIFVCCYVSFLDSLHAAGPDEFGQSIRPSVCLSVMYFSRNLLINFLRYCAWSQNHSGSILMDLILRESSYFSWNMENGPKMSKKWFFWEFGKFCNLYRKQTKIKDFVILYFPVQTPYWDNYGS